MNFLLVRGCARCWGFDSVNKEVRQSSPGTGRPSSFWVPSLFLSASPCIRRPSRMGMCAPGADRTRRMRIRMGRKGGHKRRKKKRDLRMIGGRKGAACKNCCFPLRYLLQLSFLRLHVRFCTEVLFSFRVVKKNYFR